MTSRNAQTEDMDRTPGPHPSFQSLAPDVTQHVACASCAYDLHGLPGDGKCPECGLEIARTFSGLEHRRLWLTRVRSGVLALIVAHYVLIVSIIIFPVLPIGICLYILLQLGAAVEFEPKIAGAQGHSRRYTAPLIGAAMIFYVAFLLLLAISYKLAIVTVCTAIAIHIVATAFTWQAFMRSIGPKLSVAADRMARWMLVPYYIAATACLLLTALVPALSLTGQTAAAAGLVETGLPIMRLGFVVSHSIGLFSLHTARVAMRRLREIPTEAPELE